MKNEIPMTQKMIELLATMTNEEKALIERWEEKYCRAEGLAPYTDQEKAFFIFVERN